MAERTRRLDLRPTRDFDSMVKLGREAGLEIEKLGPTLAAYGFYDGDRLIGCACLKEHDGAFLIECLAVTEQYRRMGIGTRLARAVEAEAKSRGAKELLALARQPTFFLKNGYRVADSGEVRYPSTASCEGCPQFRTSCSPAVVVKTL